MFKTRKKPLTVLIFKRLSFFYFIVFKKSFNRHLVVIKKKKVRKYFKNYLQRHTFEHIFTEKVLKIFNCVNQSSIPKTNTI